MGTKTSTFGVGNRESHDSKDFYARKLSEFEPDLTTEPEVPAERSVDALFAKSSTDMSELTDNSVGLMFTSPPYHVGKEYDTDEPFDKFFSEVLVPVLKEVYRVLEPGGRAVVNVAGLGRTPYLPFPTLVDQAMVDIGFLPRGEIIWIKGEGANGSCAWGSWLSASNPCLRDLHEKLLVYSKGRFDRHPSVRKGKRPTEDKEAFMRDTLSVWKVPPESAKRVKHPAPFPEELARRVIELYSYPEDLILDPFIGSGTTAVAAVQTGRHYVGYDNVQSYIDDALTRIAAAEQRSKGE